MEFELIEDRADPKIYNSLGREKKSLVDKMKPLLADLTENKADRIRLSTKKYSYSHLKKLVKIGVLTITDKTHYFYSTATKNYITPKPTEYRIDRDKLFLLLQSAEETKELQQTEKKTLAAKKKELQKKQLQFILQIILANGKDNRQTHDFLLFAMKPDLRKTYIETLQELRTPRGIENKCNNNCIPPTT